MYKYSISKYNPQLRDNEGEYINEDWTAISDIGKTFNGYKLSMKTYKKVEDTYIKAIQLIIELGDIPYLTIKNVNRSLTYKEFHRGIEDYKCIYNKDIIETYLGVKNMDNLKQNKIDCFCRLLLREDIGAKVYYKQELKIFIGYDYLMGIHCSYPLEIIIPKIEEMKLYVEKF